MNILYVITLCISMVLVDGSTDEEYVEMKSLNECLFNVRKILETYKPEQLGSMAVAAGCMVSPGRDAKYEEENS